MTDTILRLMGPHAAPARRGIGVRLLAFIVLFSSFVTLVLTAIELYIDFRVDVNTIEERLNEIERGYLDSLGSSLWNVDLQQIRLQLDGILRLPDMRAAEVRETVPGIAAPIVVAAGAPSPYAALVRERAIKVSVRGGERTIGVFRVEASLEGVYQRLLNKTAIILVSQGVKTFIVSLFILFIVHRLVTRVLVDIAARLDAYERQGRPGPLRIPVPPGHHADELGRVVKALNASFDGLHSANRQLVDMNAELERDIAARLRAEQEVVRLNAGLEQRVRQRTAELEAANGELDSFVYSVSHDLRAPVRRIEGFTRLLGEDPDSALSDKGRHYLTRIRAGAGEMGEMIESFLKLSRSTRADLAISTVDLSALAAQALANLREREPERAVTAEVQPGLTVQGDPRLLDVVVGNLIGNAWKYSRNVPAAVIGFGAQESGGKTVYIVRDNGAGFAAELADRLFVPFVRLHRPEEFEGSGIGLATVRRILARHGGRIWAESDTGRGATFFFTLWEPRGTDEPPHDPAGRG